MQEIHQGSETMMKVVEELKKPIKSSVIFKKLVSTTGLPVNFLAEQVFEVTPKTFTKYKTYNVKLTSLFFEHVIRFNTLYELGLEIFGTNEEFNSWLMENNIGLGNKRPSEFLNTSTGIELVYEELKRIEYGATA
jgi:putative toxin-antitoxin system antitoxin component (TIGR02293 family)